MQKKLHTAVNTRRSKFASFLTSRSGRGGGFTKVRLHFSFFFILFYLHKSWWAGSIWMGLIMVTKCPGPLCDRVFMEEDWTNEIQTPQHTSACQGEIVLCTYEEINSEQNVKIRGDADSRVHWVHVKHCNPTRYETDGMHFLSLFCLQRMSVLYHHQLSGTVCLRRLTDAPGIQYNKCGKNGFIQEGATPAF